MTRVFRFEKERPTEMRIHAAGNLVQLSHRREAPIRGTPLLKKLVDLCFLFAVIS
jgi:hypothetical protein